MIVFSHFIHPGLFQMAVTVVLSSWISLFKLHMNAYRKIITWHFIQPYLWPNAAVTNAWIFTFFICSVCCRTPVLIGPEGLYLCYFQSLSLSLTYILQPVCWHRRFDDLTCSVTMVSFTCTVSCGPLVISSWAQLLEKLPTGTGHNYISTWPLKKFHFDVMPLKGTNGFKPWIVVANHISWFLHLWQTELLLSISVSGLLELNGLC